MEGSVQPGKSQRGTKDIGFGLKGSEDAELGLLELSPVVTTPHHLGIFFFFFFPKTLSKVLSLETQL